MCIRDRDKKVLYVLLNKANVDSKKSSNKEEKLVVHEGLMKSRAFNSLDILVKFRLALTTIVNLIRVY